MQKDGAMPNDSATGEGTSGGRVPGVSRQVPESSSKGAFAQQLTRPPLTPAKALGVWEVDLAELVACNMDSVRQAQLFVQTFKNDKAYQHQVLNRDRKYLSSRTPEGYEKAANLRLITRRHGDAALLRLYPWNDHLIEGFRLAEERLALDGSEESSVSKFMAREMMLYQAQRSAEAREIESQKRWPTRRGGDRGRGSPVGEEGPAGGQSSGRGVGSTKGQSSGREGGQAREQRPTDTESNRRSKPASRGRPPLHPSRPAAPARTAVQAGGVQTAASPTSGVASSLTSQGTALVTRAEAAARGDAFQAAAVSGIAQQANELSHTSTPGSQSAGQPTTSFQSAAAQPERLARADKSSKSGTAKSEGGDRSSNSSRSTTSGSGSTSQSATSSDQLRTGSQSGARSNTSSPSATPGSGSTLSSDTSPQYTRSYLVSESAMEQLHKRLQDARASESARRRMEPPQDRGRSRQRNR